jgi:hypothetical protein
MADALDRIPRPIAPAEPDAQIAPSRERDEEEARAAAAGVDDEESASSPEAKR